MKKALALLLVGMMATAGVAQASEVMENEGAVFEEAPLETTEHMYYQDNKKPFYVNNQIYLDRFECVSCVYWALVLDDDGFCINLFYW